jgi:TnpA family transposase
MLHIERLKRLNDIELPEGLERTVHKNWLQRLAKEGGQMTAQHLRDLETDRRLATLVAVAFDTRATLIDETIELHDRIMGKLFSRAKRTHSDKFQKSGRAINDKLRLYTRIGNALLKAKESGEDPFSAIESILPWEDFRQSVTQAEELSQNESFDYLPLLASGFRQLRRYSPEFLAVLNWRAAPAAQSILDGIEVLKTMNALQKRKVPETAPVSFVRKRWEKLVFTADGIDRPFYELCVMSELRNSLRSGDIWVEGSRQFKDFEEYLVPRSVFTCQREQRALGLEVTSSCEQFLEERLGLLEHELAAVERLAEQKELPDALVTPTGLKVSPLANTVPEEAGALAKQVYSSLPHLKVTDLLLEVDRWTDFTRYFTHLKSGEPAANKNLLLTALLADAINLGLAKMTESCPGTTYAKLSWLQAWHIRDETYSKALAELVNTQSSHPLAAFWGDGTSSSSDGQNFKVGGRGRFSGQVNRKYGFEPGIQFYTHVSDQYSPFHTKIISTTIRDATHVLDGLLYHESELQIKEHYTDTSGFTDHVFALMHLLGYRFAPRIRGLSDKRLYITGDPKRFPALSGLIGGRINLKIIRDHWDEILRLAVSIKQGSVTASLMLRKLGSYPRQNRLSVALRELGRVERTLFTLEWLQDVELRRRVQSGLNKGEARNALARAVFFNQLGELRDRRFENQRYKASGLNLVVAAIILWNTVYLGRVIDSLREKSTVQEDLLQHLSPLGWSHINLTGDYTWEESKRLREGEFRPLRISRIS